MFNGGHRTIDRVKNKRPQYIENWSACLLGGVQPGPLGRLVGNLSDDGLVQRFLFVYGRNIGEGEDREPDYAAVTAYQDLIKNLVGEELAMEAKPITLSDDAQEVRAEINRMVNDLMVLPDTSLAMKGHLSKWDGIFSRLLLTYHAVECVSLGIPITGVVCKSTADRAGCLMTRYILPNIMRFYTEILREGEHLRHVRWIAGHILSRHLESITTRDIYRRYRVLDSDKGKINKIMQVLEMSGWVVHPDQAKSGKVPTKWVVNPKVHKLFALRAQEERERREEEKKKIAKAKNNVQKMRMEEEDAA